ncbi:MAG: glutamine amidotransferase [Bacillota bacterium]|uniref:type 1 glutamine amidotransferase n=1 Tax=Desulforudis sp. DRI-14 TaxID=3459793 RepID=UPI00346E6B8B
MLTVCHLYPDLLNLYGDRGNIISFTRRCQWRGIPVRVLEVGLGEHMDFSKVDFLFLGGGSDREQDIIAADLLTRRDALRDAFESGLTVLAICGGYQLLGHFYRTLDGKEIPALGLLDLYTQAGEKRLKGNIAVEVDLDGETVLVTGYENHAGQTFLGSVVPLGKVLAGYGNNGIDGWEGARYKNVFCSYLHGPLLPKNPQLTDYLITLALQRRGKTVRLAPLDDRLERQANALMLSRLNVN